MIDSVFWEMTVLRLDKGSGFGDCPRIKREGRKRGETRLGEPMLDGEEMGTG